MSKTTKEATREIQDFARSKYGEELDAAAFNKSVAKLKRWLQAAHGGLEWDEINDPGESWDYYYQETIEDKTGGKDTANRQGFGIGMKKKFKIRGIK